MLCAYRLADVLIVRRCQLLLRLNHFYVVGDARGEAILRLGDRLLRKVQAGPRDLDLLRGRFQIQQCVLDLLLDACLSGCRLAPGVASRWPRPVAHRRESFRLERSGCSRLAAAVQLGEIDAGSFPSTPYSPEKSIDGRRCFHDASRLSCAARSSASAAW